MHKDNRSTSKHAVRVLVYAICLQYLKKWTIAQWSLFLLSIALVASHNIVRGSSLQEARMQPDVHIIVRISEQKLYLYRGETVLASYAISSSKYGIGNINGSYKTPLGKHKIAQKIGASEPIGTIFVGRVAMNKQSPIWREPYENTEDLVLTRILWLEGLEAGLNKGSGIDSFARFIYIHGTHEEWRIGTPASHGCIRMHNEDVIALFEKVTVGTLVDIRP